MKRELSMAKVVLAYSCLLCCFGFDLRMISFGFVQQEWCSKRSGGVPTLLTSSSSSSSIQPISFIQKKKSFRQLSSGSLIPQRHVGRLSFSLHQHHPGRTNEQILLEKEQQQAATQGDFNKILLNEILSSFTTGNDDIILKKYIHDYIEYTDTSFYKSVYGKKALVKTLNDRQLSFFGRCSCDDSDGVVQIRDIVIHTMLRSSTNEATTKNGQISKLSILYTIIDAQQNNDNNNKDASSNVDSGFYYGISTIEIEDQKIKAYFGVKQQMHDSLMFERLFGGSNDHYFAGLSSLFAGDNHESDNAPTLENRNRIVDKNNDDGIEKHNENKESILVLKQNAITTVTKFFETRRYDDFHDNDNDDVDQVQKSTTTVTDLFASDCLYLLVPPSRTLKDSYEKQFLLEGEQSATSSLFIHNLNDDTSSSLDSLDTMIKFVIDDILVSHSSTNKDEMRIITKWHILQNNEMVGLSRGCSYFVLKREQQPQQQLGRSDNYDDDNNNAKPNHNLKIVYGVDIHESSKIEKSDAHSIRKYITPKIQNYIRDSGIGRFIADSLVKVSLPSLVYENPDVLSEFFKLGNRMNQISYGQHRSQVIDLILPDDKEGSDETVTGIAVFVVS